MQFPWMMYRKGQGLALPNGESVTCEAARDEAEYNDALREGWFPSVPEALAEKLDAPPLAKPMEPKVEPRRDPPGTTAGPSVAYPASGKPKSGGQPDASKAPKA